MSSEQSTDNDARPQRLQITPDCTVGVHLGLSIGRWSANPGSLAVEVRGDPLFSAQQYERVEDDLEGGWYWRRLINTNHPVRINDDAATLILDRLVLSHAVLGSIASNYEIEHPLADSDGFQSASQINTMLSGGTLPADPYVNVMDPATGMPIAVRQSQAHLYATPREHTHGVESRELP